MGIPISKLIQIKRRFPSNTRRAVMPDSKEIDYRDLLKKYMSVIMYQEGIDYVSYAAMPAVGDEIHCSDEDIKKLKEISKEIEP